MQGSDGNFYGTTASGGTNGRGTVFKITPSGIETVLFSFPAGSSDPYTGLIQGSDGNFYGTTGAGGTSDDGTVFKITPSGTQSVLHAFAKSGSDGETPYAGLIQGSDGNFYGTTYFGGANGFGTVFKVTPGGTETVLYSFAGGGDGQHPYAGVIQGSDGNFYGTTYQGGSRRLWHGVQTHAERHRDRAVPFAGGSGDGANSRGRSDPRQRRQFLWMHASRRGQRPRHRLQAHTGRHRDHTARLCGRHGDGANPPANLVEGSDGNLYGSTGAGGAGGHGTFFKVTLQ